MSYRKILILITIFIVTFSVSLFLKKSETIEYLFSSKTHIKFDKEIHDFGKLKYKEEEGVYFVYNNNGNNSFRIKSVTSSCGCTIPVWSRKKLAPNQKDSILVSYDSKKEGYFSKSIYIVSNSKTSPDVLYIKGIVKK